MEANKEAAATTTTELLETLSKEDLIAKCKQLLEEKTVLLKSIPNATTPTTTTDTITTATTEPITATTKKNKKKQHKQRVFDFSKYGKRRMAFKFLYLGWDYQGFAAQENTKNTIEEELFEALTKSKLIEKREGVNYSRCGRTDKGVSAFGQVIALDVRSNKPPSINDDVASSDLMKDMDTELPYVQILNRVLPPSIRVVAHTPVSKDFDARFSCKTRVYKYYFPAANLDIELMNTAAQKLTGEKDFRNFCKVDVGNNVNHFTRNIVSFTVRRINNNNNNNGNSINNKDIGNSNNNNNSDNNNTSPHDMCEMEIVGLAFLWHQVRCMVAVLMFVGLRLEQPDVLDFLLDIQRCPKKPQYNMASELPLVFFDCRYDNIEWIYNNEFNQPNVNKMVQLLSKKTIESTILRSMFDDLCSRTSVKDVCHSQMCTILPSHRPRESYKELRKRHVCEGLDRHMEIIEAKRIKLEEKYNGSKEDAEEEVVKNGVVKVND